MLVQHVHSETDTTHPLRLVDHSSAIQPAIRAHRPDRAPHLPIMPIAHIVHPTSPLGPANSRPIGPECPS